MIPGADRKCVRHDGRVSKVSGRRLGRGLDFLLSGSEGEEAATPDEAVREDEQVDPKSIVPNPWQPRTHFEPSALEDLVRSVKTHGIIQPLVVRRKANGEIELVAGERRLLASKKAGLKSVPVVFRDLDDKQMPVVALIENIQRQDLNAIERARAFRELTKQGMSHKQVADATGVGRSTVSNSLRLLELDDTMQEAVFSGKITEGHARAILAEADPERRQKVYKDILEGNLTVRQAEEGVSAKAPVPAPPSGKRRTKSNEAKVLEKNMRESLGTKVDIRERGSRGKIVISYRNLEEFDLVYRTITGETPDV